MGVAYALQILHWEGIGSINKFLLICTYNSFSLTVYFSENIELSQCLNIACH